MHHSVYSSRILVVWQFTGSASGGSGIPVYPQKIRRNTQKYPKFIQIYPKLMEALYTVYLNSKKVLSCNIPYTWFKKPLYTVYPKTLADPEFTFTGILYLTLQRCKVFGNVTVKNYLNESCCRFCASLFTVSVPSRKGFWCELSKMYLIASLVCTHAIEIGRYFCL